MTKKEREAIRAALADYMWSEGCSCCEDTEAHPKHRARLAKLLDVPEHPEEAGYYDFSPYRTGGAS